MIVYIQLALSPVSVLFWLQLLSFKSAPLTLFQFGFAFMLSASGSQMYTLCHTIMSCTYDNCFCDVYGFH